MIIYALEAGGRAMSAPLCYAATVERAQKDAEERLKGYHESAKADPEGWADAHLLDALRWELKPYTFAHGAFTEPKPRWTAMMDDTYAFTIREIEVLE